MGNVTPKIIYLKACTGTVMVLMAIFQSQQRRFRKADSSHDRAR